MIIQKPKTVRSVKRRWIRRILITLAVIVIFPIGLFTISWLNRDTIIDVLQEWYNETHTGSLSIGRINSSLLRDFPKIGFTLKDIQQTSFDTVYDKKTTIFIKEARIVVGARKLLMGNIKFEKIFLKDATISSEILPGKSYDYHLNLRLAKENADHEKFQFPAWLSNEKLTYGLENVQYITEDSIFNKYFNLNIHSIKGTYSGNSKKISGENSIDITANALGFNTKKGAFANGARIRGNPKYVFSLEEEQLNFSEFLLNVDEQLFTVNASLDVSNDSEYKFTLANDNTDFLAIKGLLPDSIALKLKNYAIIEPFNSNTEISGSFGFGKNPEIRAEFSTTDNAVIIANQKKLTKVSFSGSLTNDVYKTDELRETKKTKKDIKLNFEAFNAKLEDIQISLSDSYFQSTPDALNLVHANIKAGGSNETLASVIEADNFDFQGGTFLLNASIEGDVSQPQELANNAKGNLTLSNTRVVLKKNGLQLPIDKIELDLSKEIAYLKQFKIALPNGQGILLTGTLNNPAGLLADNPDYETSSSINLNSNGLNLNEVINMATQFVPKSNTVNADRKNLNETIDALYNKFQPDFTINLNAIEYNGIVLRDLHTQFAVVDPETISFSKFQFNYLDSSTLVEGAVVVPETNGSLKDPINLNLNVKSDGPIDIFSELFNIELLDIDQGNYSFQGKVRGNINRFQELMRNAKGSLLLTDNKMYYEPAEIEIAFDSLSLDVDNSDLYLTNFDVELGDLQPIKFKGRIEQFPSFLLDEENDQGSVFLNINAPYINGDELLSMIQSLKDEDKSTSQINQKKLHSIFEDINHFNPNIELNIDSLRYNELISKNIDARIYFENDSIIKLQEFNIDYKDSRAIITGELNAHSSQKAIDNDNPFDFDLEVKVAGKSKDLNDYLKTINFVFNTGDFEFNGRYKGQTSALNTLTSEAFGELKLGPSMINYVAADLLIPVDSLNIEIDDNVAVLKKLDINLPGKSSIDFSGSINNFSSFINNSSAIKKQKSSFTINSDYLDTQDIKTFLESAETRSKDSVKRNFDLPNFKEAMMGINSSFYPSLSFGIDSLKHKKFDITDFGISFLFNDNGDFLVKDTRLNFYGGSAELNIKIGITDTDKLPVEINMEAENIKLHEILDRMDYFNDEDLKNAKRIEGFLDYQLLANGWLDNAGKLEPSSLNGTLKLDLSELVIEDYKPILDNIVLLKRERFKKLRFQPIVQTFQIRDGEVIVPRTEIQSSALQLFIEGRIKYNEFVDLWISLPWKNLRSIDGLSLPEKTTFEKAGSKFYLQLLQDKNNPKPKKQDLKIKFKLSNRKLKKEKENLNN